MDGLFLEPEWVKKRALCAKKNYDITRAKIFAHYGMECSFCKETIVIFLTIDHIDPLRELNQKRQPNFYYWLIRNNFPCGFQTLCHNCNKLKHIQSRRGKSPSSILRLSYRQLALNHYGKVCSCCSESRFDCLAIDHIEPRHKTKIGPRDHIAPWLVNNNFPPGFQILCHNCNFAKHVYGTCPHQLK